MLLRSSSTPILSSIRSSFPVNPNNAHNNESPNITPFQSRISLHEPAFFHKNSLSCTSSPAPSLGLRRAHSESNLGDLVSDSSDSFDQLGFSVRPINPSSRSSYIALETIPSFRGKDREEDDEYGSEDEQITEEKLDAFYKKDVDLRVVDCDLKGSLGLGLKYSGCHSGSIGSEMYLAKGLGIDQGACFGQGYMGEMRDSDGGENFEAVDEYYRRELDKNPAHPLLLRNYAEFLYHGKRDLQMAEQFYWRAMLEDPKDGEVLSSYAMLVWELHRDKDRALSYFNRAMEAAPNDSHVAAAYASFLWEFEEDEDGGDAMHDLQTASPLYFNGNFASITAKVY